MVLISGFKKVMINTLASKGWSLALSSSTKRTPPVDKTDWSIGYSENILSVPADSCWSGIEAVSSESAILWIASIFQCSSLSSNFTDSTWNPIMDGSKEAKYFTTLSWTVLSSANPFGMTRERNKFSIGLPKSANSLHWNQLYIVLSLAILILAPNEIISVSFSNPALILARLFSGIPSNSHSSWFL